MVVTFLLSTVVPNVITVLAVLPLIVSSVNGLRADEATRRRLLTVLGLGVIYAANIGGMASLIGSPQNGLLLLALAKLETPGRELLTFGRWLLFAGPMAAALLFAAWGVLAVWNRRTLSDLDLRGLDVPRVAQPADLRVGAWILGLTLFGCVGAVALELDIRTLAGLALLWFSSLLVVRLPGRGERVLRLRDLWRGLPVRGIAFAVGAAALGLALERFGLVSSARDALVRVMPSTISYELALLVLTVITIFATELLSNTATAIAMWAIAVTLAASAGFPPLILMLGIGFGASAAFMSPLATPATGMAFGGLPGLRLRTMLGCGLVVNLMAAVWIPGCLLTWIPWVLQLSG